MSRIGGKGKIKEGECPRERTGEDWNVREKEEGLRGGKCYKG